MGGRKEGALGALTGLQTGIMGLALKPAAGAVDFATSAIGGIVSQSRAAAAGPSETPVVNRRCAFATAGTLAAGYTPHTQRSMGVCNYGTC